MTTDYDCRPIAFRRLVRSSGTVAVTSRRGQPAKETSTALSNSREEDGPVRVVIQSTRNFINPWSQSGHEPMSDLSDHSRRCVCF